MPEERKLRVFLCHASQDKPAVRELYQRLLAEGWIDPWLDEENLLPGQDWDLEIEKAVEAAEAVIVCLSKNSVTKEGYIQKELRAALDVALEKPEETIFIIPVRLEDCELPRRLRARQYVDYFAAAKEEPYQRLLLSLKVRLNQLLPEKEYSEEKNSQSKMAEKTKYYFVGHQLTEENVKDLRMFIESVFTPKGWKPYYAEREFGSQPILLKICQKLYFTDIGIFDLSTPNPNVYIEFGIALAFNKKVIVIAREGTILAPALLGLPVITYKNYTELTQKLEASFETLARERPKFIDFCNYCGKICEGMTVYPDRNTYLFMEKRGLLSRSNWEDLKSIFEPYLQKWNLQSVSLRDTDSRSLLCNIRKKVRTTQFAISHLGNLAEPDSYIALGMCIGYCRPWFLISKLDEDNRESAIPSNLLGLDRLQYSSLDDLRGRLEDDLPGFLNLLYPPKDADQQTASIAREKTPFWLLLIDWLEKKQAPHITGIARGMLRLVQVGNYGFLDKFLITRRGIELGRDRTCDIVIAHNHISSKHARIYEQDGACYLQDLHSRNGTFYNGHQLLPGDITMIVRGDRIRLAHAERYLVWDDTPLPTDSYFLQADPGKTGTGVLEPVEILLPTEGLSGLDESLDYTYIVDIQGLINGIFQVQSYYRLGRVLEEIARIRNFVAEDCCFVYCGKLVDDEQTILDLNMQLEDSLYLMTYKDFVKNSFIQKLRLIEDDELRQYVDFVLEENEHGEKRVVMIQAVKKEIKFNQIQDLIYAPALYRKSKISKIRELLLTELAAAEKSFREIEEAKRQAEQLGRSIITLVGKVVDHPERRLEDLNRTAAIKRNALDKLRQLEIALSSNVESSRSAQQDPDIKSLIRALNEDGVIVPPLDVRKLVIVSSERVKKRDPAATGKLTGEQVRVLTFKEVEERLEQGQLLSS